jgi:flagellar hook assembly protein FlgD
VRKSALRAVPAPELDPFGTGIPHRDATLRPNPFNASTVVEFSAVAGSSGSVTVYNLRGERVLVLHNGEIQRQEFRWDGTDSRGAAVASGVYVVRAEVDGAAQTAKMALVKSIDPSGDGGRV